MSDQDVVIRVEGLGKRYSLHHQQPERYRSLRDSIADRAKAAGRLLNPFTLAGQLGRSRRQAAQELAASEEEFWALKDVSFEIRRGERVGIIGRNGAGKSTLLKILSRITEPTTGRVELRGRVASLLEVGTGFHPELTGRENIYLNGAILGMTRREIRAKFDEIVAFAEVEKFLDTPVKRYSSGMYVRLAFAVAAHLEPEILVVDEVLAVGDASFQKKCLGKMEDVAEQEGRTVLFVSHQMSAIQSLCSYGLLLQAGRIGTQGKIQSVVDTYLSAAQVVEANDLTNVVRSGNGSAQFYSVYPVNDQGQPLFEIRLGQSIKICFEITAKQPIDDLSIGFSLHDLTGQTLSINYSDFDQELFDISNNHLKVFTEVDQLPLRPGRYTVGVRMLRKGYEVDWPKETACSFEIVDAPFYKNPNITHSGKGLLALRPKWSL